MCILILMNTAIKNSIIIQPFKGKLYNFARFRIYLNFLKIIIKKKYTFFRKLGLDLVPRCGAEMVDPATMSVVELYKVVSLFYLNFSILMSIVSFFL